MNKISEDFLASDDRKSFIKGLFDVDSLDSDVHIFKGLDDKQREILYSSTEGCIHFSNLEHGQVYVYTTKETEEETKTTDDSETSDTEKEKEETSESESEPEEDISTAYVKDRYQLNTICIMDLDKRVEKIATIVRVQSYVIGILTCAFFIQNI